MRQAVVLRKLEETQERLERARHELVVLDEQFAALDDACRAGDAGFADFGLNQTSLEEVFVNVVEGAA